MQRTHLIGPLGLVSAHSVRVEILRATAACFGLMASRDVVVEDRSYIGGVSGSVLPSRNALASTPNPPLSADPVNRCQRKKQKCALQCGKKKIGNYFPSTACQHTHGFLCASSRGRIGLLRDAFHVWHPFAFGLIRPSCLRGSSSTNRYSRPPVLSCEANRRVAVTSPLGGWKPCVQSHTASRSAP